MNQLAIWKKRKFWSPSWVYSRWRDVFKMTYCDWAQDEFSVLFRKIRPYTLCSPLRLQALYEGIRDIEAKGIEGDIVECGVARGGSGALMGLALRDNPSRRRLWLLDTFEGLPPPSPKDPDHAIAEAYTGAFKGGENEVRALLKSLAIQCPVELLKGLYLETLPRASIGKIALLHIDCDWYESVQICLDTLYDRISAGGIVQIDDFGHWEGARGAVEDFFRYRGLKNRLMRIDYEGRRWVK